MELERWKALSAYMQSVWHRAIGPIEEAAGFKLLGALPDEAVEAAVTELAELGGEFLPAWSQIFARASAITKGLRPALPPSDLTRPLSDAERERATRMGALLRGGGATAIQETWSAFAKHRCAVCDAVAGIVRRGGRQSDYYATLESKCCEVGRPPYSAWRRAVTEVVRQAFHQREQIA